MHTLNKAETLWIKNLRTLAPGGYNLTTGGEGASGLRHTEETRAKMRFAKQVWFSSDANRALHLRRMESFEYRTALAASMSSDLLARRTASVSKFYKDPKNLAAFKAKMRTASHRRACSEGAHSRFKTATTKQRAAWRKAITDGHRTSEARSKCSISAKARWAALTSEERSAWWYKVRGMSKPEK